MAHPRPMSPHSKHSKVPLPWGNTLTSTAGTKKTPHIASYESQFSTLPGDHSKAYTTYSPEAGAVAVNQKNAPAEEEDIDLFGSDEEEEEDPEAVAEREKRLAEYRKKKEGKAKPAAKFLVTLDVKPWGIPPFDSQSRCIELT